MTKQSHYVTCRMACPEGRGDTSMLVEWRFQKGKELISSITCSNPQLRDLSGYDCTWSCWETVAKEKKK